MHLNLAFFFTGVRRWTRTKIRVLSTGRQVFNVYIAYLRENVRIFFNPPKKNKKIGLFFGYVPGLGWGIQKFSNLWIF